MNDDEQAELYLLTDYVEYHNHKSYLAISVKQAVFFRFYNEM